MNLPSGCLFVAPKQQMFSAGRLHLDEKKKNIAIYSEAEPTPFLRSPNSFSLGLLSLSGTANQTNNPGVCFHFPSSNPTSINPNRFNFISYIISHSSFTLCVHRTTTCPNLVILAQNLLPVGCHRRPLNKPQSDERGPAGSC